MRRRPRRRPSVAAKKRKPARKATAAGRAKSKARPAARPPRPARAPRVDVWLPRAAPAPDWRERAFPEPTPDDDGGVWIAPPVPCAWCDTVHDGGPERCPSDSIAEGFDLDTGVCVFGCTQTTDSLTNAWNVAREMGQDIDGTIIHDAGCRYFDHYPLSVTE